MTCGAEPPDQVMLGGQAVQVQVYDCYWSEQEATSHQFVVISPVCPTYIAQPVLLKGVHAHKGWVMNRFGEFYPATVNIEMMDVYRPPLLKRLDSFRHPLRLAVPSLLLKSTKN
jgi:hypothetical protein